MKRSIFLFAIFLVFQSGVYAQKKVLLDAMKDELARTMEQLKLNGEAGPYYVSYFLQDAHTLRITADYGAITVNSDNQYRTLKVDLRVGSYDQDNSNFLSLANIAGLVNSGSSNVRIPIDDNYDVLRTQIWQATDRAYKTALETLSKKKASLQNTVQAEPVPDFSKSETISSLGTENSMVIQKEQWSQLVDQLSKLFLKQPGIQKSKVDLNVQIANFYYVNSEGTAGIEPFSVARLSVVATTQADDGMPLQNFRAYTADRPEGLPEKAKLDSDVKTLISEILAAKSAPVAEEYSGPVLFADQAAGELFSQGLGNLLVARKPPVADSPQTNAMLSRYMENPFVSKLNMKVAASFLSLKATPALKSSNQKALLGAYALDEEGVRSREVSLIENGILKGLMSSRAPVKGIAQSNGHGRGGGPAPSVIRVISTNKKTYQQLKEALINAAKEEGLAYGYMVRGLTPASEAASGDADIIESLVMSQQGPPEPTQFLLTRPYSVFRIYPDGREELVRGVEFGSVSINAFKNVLATSDDEFVYDYPVSSSGILGNLSGILSLLGGGSSAGLGYNATVITPSMLVGGIDLKKSKGNYPKLPIVSYPAQ
jgi:predicted Zn-dependent protease